MISLKKKSLCLLFVFIFGFDCFVALTSACAEPVHQGKGLSEWLLDLHARPTAADYEEAKRQNIRPEMAFNIPQERARAAIRRIGTNCVPTLLELVGVTERNRKKVLSKLKSNQLRQSYRSKDSKWEDLQKLGVEGFGILGTNADFAVPQLKELFLNGETCFEAARALVQVGTRGVTILTEEFDPAGTDINNVIIWVLGEDGPKTKEITELLIKALKDPSPANRAAAGKVLAGRDPSAMPALVEMLETHGDFLSVNGACDGLQGFGPAAKAFAPKLYQVFTNHVVVKSAAGIRESQGWGVSLLRALKAVDMETAAKAEDFLVNSGPLNYTRYGHTITLLNNGKTLIVGGSIHTEIPVVTNRYLSSAQLLDSASGKWEETGKMHAARYGHVAILLGDGRVLVAGGSDNKGHELTSAELYDPNTGEWKETGSMTEIHPAPKATLLGRNKVRLSAGWKGSRTPEDEVYDPATEKWTSVE